MLTLYQTQLAQVIIAKCQADAEFKVSLLADPRIVLTAEGYEILPEDKPIRIIESLEDEHIFYIPFDKARTQLSEKQNDTFYEGYEYLGWG